MPKIKKPRWLICNLGKSENIQSIYYGAIEAGYEAEVKSLKECADLLENKDETEDCVITVGSIWFNSTVKKQRPNWTGCFHNNKIFSCSNYYPYWSKYITQKDCKFLKLNDLNLDIANKYSDGESFFIRPDSGEKEFTGQLVRLKDFDTWIKNLTSIYEVKLDELIVISKPVKIFKELRLIVVDKKIISGSTYIVNKFLLNNNLNYQEDKNRIVEFAEKVLNDNPPPLPPFHVLDIAVHDDDSLSVMELGCFCCCGMYDCDRPKVVKAISQYMESHG